MNSFNLLRACSCVGLVWLVVGCSAVGQSDFSCDGPTPGLSCLPAMEVYEITNDPVLHQKVLAALEDAAESGEPFDHMEVVSKVRSQYKPHIETIKKLAQPIMQPRPILHPAKVLKIYIAPWIDQKGDLHMPGNVFTEVTPRRWSIGDDVIPELKILAPLQVEKTDKPISET